MADSNTATMSVESAGRLLGIGRNSAYEAARQGTIPTLRFGKRVVVPRAALMRLLGEREAPADEKAKGMFTGLRPDVVAQAVRLADVRHATFGDDALMRGRVTYPEKLALDEAPLCVR